MEIIDKVELRFLNLNDYEGLKEVMKEAYRGLSEAYWKKSHLKLKSS